MQPYERGRGEVFALPNTSFALADIAQRIAQIRGTSVEHIIELSYENASRFFSV